MLLILDCFSCSTPGYLFDWLTLMVLHCDYWQVYCKVSGNPRPAVATVDVTGQEFYGPGYDDSDKRIPDMTIIKRQLGKQFTKVFVTILQRLLILWSKWKGSLRLCCSLFEMKICQEVILMIWWSAFWGQSGSLRLPFTIWWSIPWPTNILPTPRQ